MVAAVVDRKQQRRAQRQHQQSCLPPALPAEPAVNSGRRGRRGWYPLVQRYQGDVDLSRLPHCAMESKRAVWEERRWPWGVHALIGVAAAASGPLRWRRLCMRGGRGSVQTALSAGRGRGDAGRVQPRPPFRDRQMITSQKTRAAVSGMTTGTCLGWLRTKSLSARGRRRQLL